MNRNVDLIVIALIAMGAAALGGVIAHTTLIPIEIAEARSDPLTPNVLPGARLCTAARPAVASLQRRAVVAPSAERDRHDDR
jgi:hypothetical protein